MMGVFQILWISAVIMVISASLLLRVLVVTRLLKRGVAPAWLTPALAAGVVLSASCLLAAVMGANTGR